MAESTLSRIRGQRIEKLERLRALGIEPYPSQASRSHGCGVIEAAFEALEGKRVTVCGRLMFMRRQGALTFAQIQDESGRIQAALQRDAMPAEARDGALGYADLKLLDVGDFVQIEGPVAKTKRGEVSVFGDTVRLLAKGIRPLPEKHKGLADREAILRRRYLHVTTQPEIKDHFARVARIQKSAREFLWARGFIEFATPVIQTQYGGGTANPFRTHVDALGVDAYLSISHELYLKRLIAAGYEKVFTIGKYFRNEGIDRSHHPEFSMIETMTAFENYLYNMDLVEDLFRHIAIDVFGKTQFTVGDHPIDFQPAWRRVSMREAVLKETGVDFLDCTPEAASSCLEQIGAPPAATPGLQLLSAFEARVEQTLIQPTLIHDHPIEISPLAKPSASDPRVAERFEIFIGGIEVGDNWTEQNDPQALLETWERLKREAYSSPEETHPIDYDFIEVLEYGMPPTTGIGPGVERMAMIFSEERNIDDVIFFPLMRPVMSDLNREIYGLTDAAHDPSSSSPLFVTVDDLEDLLLGLANPEDHKTVSLDPSLRFVHSPTGSTAEQTHQGYGSVLIHGLVESGLVVSGYRVTVVGPLKAAKEVKRFAKKIEAVLAPVIRRVDGVSDVSVTMPADG